MLSVTATSLWFPSVNAYLVFKLSSQTPVARGPLTWQDLQLLKTHLCFSFLSRHTCLDTVLWLPSLRPHC